MPEQKVVAIRVVRPMRLPFEGPGIPQGVQGDYRVEVRIETTPRDELTGKPAQYAWFVADDFTIAGFVGKYAVLQDSSGARFRLKADQETSIGTLQVLGPNKYVDEAEALAAAAEEGSRTGEKVAPVRDADGLFSLKPVEAGKGGTIPYPSQSPRQGFTWDYEGGQWVEKPIKATKPQEELLGQDQDAYGLRDIYGFRDEDGTEHITKITRTKMEPQDKPPLYTYPTPEEADAKAKELTQTTGRQWRSKLTADGSAWTVAEGAAEPADIDQEIQKALIANDTARAKELTDRLNELKWSDPDFAQRQYEFEMGRAATTAERNRLQKNWEAEFGETARQWRTQLEQQQYEFGTGMAQRQWEQGQAAQREALKLGIDISRSPADWWALENLRYGAQANRPYTGEEVAPRTWVADWLKFANQPMPQFAQPSQPAVPPIGQGAVPSLTGQAAQQQKPYSINAGGAPIESVPIGSRYPTAPNSIRTQTGVMNIPGGPGTGFTTMRTAQGEIEGIPDSLVEQAKARGYTLADTTSLVPAPAPAINVGGAPVASVPIGSQYPTAPNTIRTATGVTNLPGALGETVMRTPAGDIVGIPNDAVERSQAAGWSLAAPNPPAPAPTSAGLPYTAAGGWGATPTGNFEVELPTGGTQKLTGEQLRNFDPTAFKNVKNIPLLDSPSEAPFPLPAVRFMAKKAGETAIINQREIPSFLDQGFKVTEKVNLYDTPWDLARGPLTNPLDRLPQHGVREALSGQPVSKPRGWPTLGAPTMPSAQSWSRLPWSGQQIFQSEVQRLGVPWEDYAPEMQSLWPSWGSQGRFRRVPNLLGGGRM